MQILSLTIEGFRCLANVQRVPIMQQTIVTGHNDGGKSALLDALDFLISGTDISVRDLSYLTASSEVQGSPTEESAERVEEAIITGEFTLSETEAVELKLPARVEIRRRFSAEGKSPLEIKRRVCKSEDLRNLDDEKIATLKELAQKYDVEPIGRGNAKESWAAPLREVSSRLPTVEEWVTLAPDAVSAVPALVYFKGDAVQSPETVVQSILTSKLREYAKRDASKKRIAELEEHLAESLTADIDHIREHIAKRCDFPTVKLDPQVQVRPALVGVELSVATEAGHEVPLSAAGTGRSRRISLALWESSNDVLGVGAGSPVAVGADVIFVYDEPDTHLDYEHQRRIMHLIQEQSALPNARVVVATHSLNLIDGVDIANVVHLCSSKTGTYAEVLSEEGDDTDVRRHLSSIATALGFRNSVLLHEKFFVGVEGPSETAAFPILFKKQMGFPIQSAGICLWSGGSNEGALKFAQFLKEHKRDVAFVVDKDSRLNQRKAFRDDKLREYGFDLNSECHYIGTPNELEDLFSDEDWVGVANAVWPAVDDRGGLWMVDDVRAHREGKFSSALLDMFKAGSESGPKGKEELMIGIATFIDKNRIPPDLIALFEVLITKAQEAGPHLWDS